MTDVDWRDVVREAAQRFIDFYDSPGRSYRRDGEGNRAIAALRAALASAQPEVPAQETVTVQEFEARAAACRETPSLAAYEALVESLLDAVVATEVRLYRSEKAVAQVPDAQTEALLAALDEVNVQSAGDFARFCAFIQGDATLAVAQVPATDTHALASWSGHIKNVRRTDVAQVPAQEERLDVERLYRAAGRVLMGGMTRASAAAIAAEYLATASAQETDHD